MSNVTIRGVEYLPASVLAKEHRYTTDYIGQLCRAKKVDAQLVGRTWYVNPLSLNTHKKSRYTKVTSSEKTSKISINKELSRIDVQTPLSKSTVKMSEKFSHNFTNRLDTPGVRYEDDDLELLPQLSAKNKPTKIPVDLADSSDISIKNKSKTTTLVPTALPEVSLTGSLKIASLDEAYVIEEEKSEDFKRVLVPKASPVVAVTAPVSGAVTPLPLSRPKFIKRAQADRELVDQDFTYRVPVSISTPVPAAPASTSLWKLIFVFIVAGVLSGANFLVISEIHATSLAAQEIFVFRPTW